MSDLINQSVNYGGDCRTAPATPGLLNRRGWLVSSRPFLIFEGLGLAIINR